MNILPKSLYQRLLLASIASSAIAIGLLGGYIAYNQGQLATRTAIHEANIFAESVASSLSSSLLVKNYGELEYTLIQLVRQSKTQKVTIIDLHGKVIITVDKNQQGALSISYGGQFPLPSTHLQQTLRKGDTIISWQQVMGATVIAWVRSEHSVSHIKALQMDILLDTEIAVLITIFLITALVAVALKKNVYQIKQAADFAVRLPQNKREILKIKPASSEVEHLVSALNNTSEQLYNQNNELKMLHSLVDYSNDSVFIIDPQDGFKLIFANDAACQHFGLSLHNLLTLRVPDFDPHFDLVNMQNLWNQLLINKHKVFETHHQLANDIYVPVEVSANYLQYKGKQYIAGYFRNITERKIAEEESKLAAMLFDNSSEGMVITDPEGVILSVNSAFTKLTGYTKEEVIGKTMNMLKSGVQGTAFYKTMWKTIINSGRWQGEIWNRRKSGESYAEWLSINTIFNDDGSVKHYVALFSDITAKKRSEELIWKQANFDTLTGLPNRQMFHDRLQQDIKKAHRNNSSLALMFLDMDRFKEINDSLGHDMGDVLLKEASVRLSNCVRDTDTVARLGGDEFTIILLQADSRENINRIANKILESLKKPFKLKQDLVYVSASIGIAVYPDDATCEKELIICADQAMYESKNQGRDCYHYFVPEMQDMAQTRINLANDLREALKKNQFNIVYQPIVELATGQINKAEALIRWQHPEQGLISPAEFIPIAESTGTILDIGNWVFYQVIEQIKQWRSTLHPDFQISINKSPVQFHYETNNTCLWLEHLSEQGLSGESIVIEITEGLMLDSEIAKGLLDYRDAGIQVALDDFGTGYSSLAYLTRFDIDYLKIDQSFVRNLTVGSNNLTLCEAIIAMAHTLKIQVIAEGIETQEQCELLTKAGCDYGQGYFFSKPVSPENFLLIRESS